ncbi:murein biosynthesis integral membrane protein MurJ [Clostridium sp. 'White wine YQ']|uniref:murein biosynthesis integral membrane protein MurJ n=1 Tax=Clostridium sp. 'White wine YQ' TaxID=3027474 RepID=UPI0023663C39|nr:murein biosynthesis integral membrane protein MurJ [Clostridium sp. 'White wine YQ']MDD7794973.1 murein biosynthesis integral membrane protein MurJ [Clostridium sp. 'White wine YQ']
MKNNKFLKSASIVMIITLFSKVIGFLRDALIAKQFGATYQTDAFNMAITIPTVLFTIFALAISTTFIPILTETKNIEGKNNMFRLANNLMNVVLVISILVGILSWVGSPIIVKIMAPNFSGETYNLTVLLTKISVMNIIFMSMNSGFTAILQTLEDFSAPALVGVAMNIPVIVYILFSGDHTIMGLTIATCIGKLGEVVIQIPWLLKHKYKYEFYINLKDKRIHRILNLIGPVIIGAGVNQLNTIVDKGVGSGLSSGSISSLDYGNKVDTILYSIFAMTVITIIYPLFAQESENKANFKKYLSKGINYINIIMIPTTVATIILSKPIVDVIFKRGAFDEVASKMTSTALIYYAIGITFVGIRDVLSRAFYALKDTKTPMKNGIIGVIVNIACNLVLVHVLDIGGIALSTSIAAIVTVIILANNLRKKINGINGGDILRASSKIVFASAIMGIGIFLVKQILTNRLPAGNTGNMILILICGVFGMIIYAILIYIFKVEEADELFKKLVKR